MSYSYQIGDLSEDRQSPHAAGVLPYVISSDGSLSYILGIQARYPNEITIKIIGGKSNPSEKAWITAAREYLEETSGQNSDQKINELARRLKQSSSPLFIQMGDDLKTSYTVFPLMLSSNEYKSLMNDFRKKELDSLQVISSVQCAGLDLFLKSVESNVYFNGQACKLQSLKTHSIEDIPLYSFTLILLWCVVND
ncbi:MAG: hypothetical protein Sylvanvirus13_17 [Sylvanvirus sp.]|uniref:Nudix hydrolase domain-containing protein n=1 Tax=Sylvanvirus sp. TaxID=2487774 RepID=A0A3G5AIA7_9VIRU|nr:MAG: hypothetical protein Sylvanvirus13_17 [Sylvanvirus sp.]